MPFPSASIVNLFIIFKSALIQLSIDLQGLIQMMLLGGHFTQGNSMVFGTGWAEIFDYYGFQYANMLMFTYIGDNNLLLKAFDLTLTRRYIDHKSDEMETSQRTNPKYPDETVMYGTQFAPIKIEDDETHDEVHAIPKSVDPKLQVINFSWKSDPKRVTSSKRGTGGLFDVFPAQNIYQHADIQHGNRVFAAFDKANHRLIIEKAAATKGEELAQKIVAQRERKRWPGLLWTTLVRLALFDHDEPRVIPTNVTYDNSQHEPLLSPG
ncbi:hypothetical protein QVD17_41240 [Tagetes erecta]|uniref:Uncharacterized protein n=1 Tax=Tagetes erecta TaxID=13708 RepID=A0AAD8NI73_TARER|nr:hypothetical protein QVD17_41240 [Tagetes erecta]